MGWVYGWLDGWMGGWVVGWMDGRTNGRMDQFKPIMIWTHLRIHAKTGLVSNCKLVQVDNGLNIRNKHNDSVDMIARNCQEQAQAHLYKNEEYQDYNCKNTDMKMEANALDMHWDTTSVILGLRLQEGKGINLL